MPENNNGNNDSTTSTEWGFLCLLHQKNLLEMELLNLDTLRAHKVTFSTTGTDTVKSPGSWLNGQFYKKFKTKFPATFDNFDNTLAMLNPKPGASAIDHILRIGWLATITIPQSPGDFFGEWNLFGSCKVTYGKGQPTRPLMYAPYKK